MSCDRLLTLEEVTLVFAGDRGDLGETGDLSAGALFSSPVVSGHFFLLDDNKDADATLDEDCNSVRCERRLDACRLSGRRFRGCGEPCLVGDTATTLSLLSE